MKDASQLDIPDLPTELRRLMAQIPRGRVTTFGALAVALGTPLAARWVAQFLSDHECRRGCTCHRVVKVDGQLSSVPEIAAERFRKLAREGIHGEPPAVEMSRYLWREFETSHPLLPLFEQQLALRHRVEIPSLQRKGGEAVMDQLPNLIGGVDVSYAADDRALAAYTLYDRIEARAVWSSVVETPARFPYIPTLLSFRELPALLQVVAAARAAERLAEITLVDGTGILHPRRFGIASHLAVIAGIRTVGVTKSHLLGKIDKSARALDHPTAICCPIEVQGERLGAAILPTASTKHPLYVSPGHGVSVELAALAVAETLRGHRLPEPLFWADKLSRMAKKP